MKLADLPLSRFQFSGLIVRFTVVIFAHLTGTMLLGQTCRNIRLEGRTILVADCLTSSGRFIESRMDLEQWFGVKDTAGDVFSSTWGQTARSVTLEGTILNATIFDRKCHPGDDDSAEYTDFCIDLDDYIGICGGTLISFAP